MKFIPCSCLAFILLADTAPGAIFYVDQNATGANNGTSWAHAFPGLQSALTAAGPGDEIDVAQGTYYPENDESANPTPADPRTKTFFINKNIALFGGFKVTNGVLEARDVDTFRTVLSGDIGTRSNVSDNCYHVLLFDCVSNACRLDGFYVQEGQANGADEVNKGGAGAYLRALGGQQTSPHFVNCRFEKNTGSRGAVLLDVYDNDDDTKFGGFNLLSNIAPWL